MLKITKNQGSIQVTADKSGFYPFDGTITFPTNSLFTATSANTDMITFKSTSNGDVQFVGNYKDITISGRSYDTKQKFLTAFSNLANQGSVDAYTKAEIDAKLDDKLTAYTNANGSLFISSRSNDDVNYSVALYSSSVNGNGDVAIGLARTLDKKGYLNLAILNNAEADGVQNIVIGDNRKCKGLNNIGIGSGGKDYLNSDVNGTGNVCIGDNSQAHTASNTAVNNSIAIGPSAIASSNYCTVVGNSANSKSSHAVAVGDNAYVEHDCDRSVAVGNSARAYGKNSVAIGCTSYATDDKPLDICCGKKDNNEVLSVLQSDANGKISLLKGNGTDERMVIQDEIEALKNAGGGGTVDAYTKAETDTKLDAKQDKLTAGSGITIDENNVISSTGGSGGGANPYVNVKGTNESATIADDVTFGIAIGERTNVTKGGGIAIGDQSQAKGRYCVSVGCLSTCIGDSTVAVGKNAKSAMGNSVAIGSGALAISKNAVAIGPGANATLNMPLVIKASDNGLGAALPMIQGDKNGKISIPLGDGTLSTMCLQDEIAALKAEIAALKGGDTTGDASGDTTGA